LIARPVARARGFSTVRTFTILTALLLVAGCKRSEQTQSPAPARPPAQASAQTTQNPSTANKEVRKARFPSDQDQFKAGLTGLTRERVHEKYGQPDETFDLPAGVGWDGPLSIYWGNFITADGKQASKARVYYRRSGSSSVVAQVEFVNK
jgi:hypothetical protein